MLTRIGSGGRFCWWPSLSFCQPADVFSRWRGVRPGGRSSTTPLLSLRCGRALLPLPWPWFRGFCDYGVDQTSWLLWQKLPHRHRQGQVHPASAPSRSSPTAAGPHGKEGDSRGTRRAGGSGTARTLGSGWLSGSPGTAARRHMDETTRGSWNAGWLPAVVSLAAWKEAAATNIWSFYNCLKSFTPLVIGLLEMRIARVFSVFWKRGFFFNIIVGMMTSSLHIFQQNIFSAGFSLYYCKCLKLPHCRSQYIIHWYASCTLVNTNFQGNVINSNTLFINVVLV